MQSKSFKSQKPKPQVPEPYIVRFTCELSLEGDVLVTAKKVDAAKAAGKLLANVDVRQLDELAQFHTKKIRLGRVISERQRRRSITRRLKQGPPPDFFGEPTRRETKAPGTIRKNTSSTDAS